jgi:hypothetical protein
LESISENSAADLKKFQNPHSRKPAVLNPGIQLLKLLSWLWKVQESSSENFRIQARKIFRTQLGKFPCRSR